MSESTASVMGNLKAKFPLVTAIVTTHNRASLLPRALDSVLEQTYPEIEIIVVDDGSTDTTDEVIKSYVDRIKYFRNETPLGACAARNRGFRMAKGEFVALLDDDDAWNPGRIEILMKNYDAKYSCIGSAIRLVLKNKQVLMYGQRKIVTQDDMLYINNLCQPLIERSRILELGGFDESLVASQDYDMWMRVVLAYGPALNIAEPLMDVYIDHETGRVSHKRYKGQRRFYFKYRRFMNSEQKRYQIYRLEKSRENRIGFKQFIAWVPIRYYRREVMYVLKSYLDCNSAEFSHMSTMGKVRHILKQALNVMRPQ